VVIAGLSHPRGRCHAPRISGRSRESMAAAWESSIMVSTVASMATWCFQYSSWLWRSASSDTANMFALCAPPPPSKNKPLECAAASSDTSRRRGTNRGRGPSLHKHGGVPGGGGGRKVVLKATRGVGSSLHWSQRSKGRGRRVPWTEMVCMVGKGWRGGTALSASDSCRGGGDVWAGAQGQPQTQCSFLVQTG
jgi:hypothetical protein